MQHGSPEDRVLQHLGVILEADEGSQSLGEAPQGNFVEREPKGVKNRISDDCQKKDQGRRDHEHGQGTGA